MDYSKMNKGQIKNMVVLKNLPSNLIEEAFVIVKNTATIKSLEYIDNKDTNFKENEKSYSNGYIVKEAENVINAYLCKAEKNKLTQYDISKNKKYRFFQLYSVFITIAFVLCIVFNSLNF